MEEQIDSATVDGIQIQQENAMLKEEIKRFEEICRKDDGDMFRNTLESTNAGNSEVTEELQALVCHCLTRFMFLFIALLLVNFVSFFLQIIELSKRLESKLQEMDSLPWQTRPSSSCSGSGDVSVR